MKKNNNKGFTLVELIVVLVILAILAAILVPALLGYIDKAREKQITTNAEAAYVAAQALATEYYGKTATGVNAKDAKDYITPTKITGLTDISEAFTFDVAMVKNGDTDTGHDACVIDYFIYKPTGGDKVAVWTRKAYTVAGKQAGKNYSETSVAGGWTVLDSSTAPTVTVN